MKLVKLAILAAVICIVLALAGKGCDMITGGGHHGDEAAPAGGVAVSADYGNAVGLHGGESSSVVDCLIKG